MTRPEFDDEMLMAFADGELDAVRADAVRRVAADDAGIASRIAMFRATRDALRQSAARPAPPVSDALRARVEAALRGARRPAPGGKAVAVGARARPRAALWQLGLAASVALVAGVLAALVMTRAPGGGDAGLALAGLEAPGLVSALGELPSGDRRVVADATLSPVATFRDAEGALCREFVLGRGDAGGLVAVACFGQAQWELRFALAAQAGDGYSPASALDALDSYLSTSGAGMPLSLEEETQALAELAR